jgi:hypothetical protein
MANPFQVLSERGPWIESRLETCTSTSFNSDTLGNYYEFSTKTRARLNPLAVTETKDETHHPFLEKEYKRLYSLCSMRIFCKKIQGNHFTIIPQVL